MVRPLYTEMTVLEFLQFIANARGLDRGQGGSAIRRVLSICQLADVQNQVIEVLSRGYRQRVGMAQAILHDPPYLIMEEPTEGLDPNQKQHIYDFISEIAENKAILLSTHVMEEVEAICNRAIIIHNGRIVADDTPSNLLKRHPRYNAIRLEISGISPEDVREALSRIPDIANTELSHNGITAYPRNQSNIHSAIWKLARDKNWEVNRIEKEPIRLDDIFKQLTKPSPESDNHIKAEK